LSFSQAELEGTIDSQRKMSSTYFQWTCHWSPDGKSGLEMSFRQKKFFKVWKCGVFFRTREKHSRPVTVSEHPGMPIFNRQEVEWRYARRRQRD